MGDFIARLVARLKALPVAQRVVLGVGIPVVAVAAAVTVKREPQGTSPAAVPVRSPGVPATGAQIFPQGAGGAGGASIPFGADLGDVFRFQTQLADLENQVRKSNAPSRRPAPQMVDDSRFVRIANDAPTADAQADVAARVTAAGANAQRAPVVATSTASPRTVPPPTLPSTRSAGRSRTPARSGPPTRTATRLREQERTPAKAPVRIATRLREQERTPAKPRPRPRPRPRVKRRKVGGSMVKAI